MLLQLDASSDLPLWKFHHSGRLYRSVLDINLKLQTCLTPWPGKLHRRSKIIELTAYGEARQGNNLTPQLNKDNHFSLEKEKQMETIYSTSNMNESAARLKALKHESFRHKSTRYEQLTGNWKKNSKGKKIPTSRNYC